LPKLVAVVLGVAAVLVVGRLLEEGAGDVEELLEIRGTLELDLLAGIAAKTVEEREDLFVCHVHLHLLLGRAVAVADDGNDRAQLLHGRPSRRIGCQWCVLLLQV